MGDLAAAERQFAAAIRKRPTYMTSFYNMGKLCLRVRLSEVFEKLPEAAKRCIHEQALDSLETYISTLERREVTHILSKEENERLHLVTLWLKWLGKHTADTKGTDKPYSYGKCLEKYEVDRNQAYSFEE